MKDEEENIVSARYLVGISLVAASFVVVYSLAL